MTLKTNKSKTYWIKRQLAHEAERHKGAEAFIDEAVRAYDAVMTKLEEAISARLVAISDNNGASMTEAMRRLSNKELAGWRMSLKEFIKLSERGNLPEDLEQVLRNASHRVHLSQLEAMKTLIDTSIRVESYNLNADLTTFLSKEWQKIINASVVKDKNKIGVGYSKEALDVVLSKPWAQDGRTFSKRIWEDGQKTSRRLQDNLEQNILLGKHPKDIIQDMQKVLPKNKRSDIARLVHTEHAYVASEADKVAFEALELEKYEICAVLDSKTSALCRSLDGKVFDLKGRKVGINAPPFHPNCRTVTLPWFEDEDDETYYVPDNMTYQEWKNGFVDSPVVVDQTQKITKKNDSNDYSVDRKLVNSKEYHDKFENLTSHKSTNESVYQEAMKMLEHRDGTDLEDIVILDARTGKVIVKNTLSVRSGQTGLTYEQYEIYQQASGKKVLLHNHPNGGRLSFTDLKTLFANDEIEASIAVGHNGIVHIVSNPNRKIDIEKLYESLYNEYKEIYANSELARIYALDDLYDLKIFDYESR